MHIQSCHITAYNSMALGLRMFFIGSAEREYSCSVQKLQLGGQKALTSLLCIRKKTMTVALDLRLRRYPLRNGLATCLALTGLVNCTAEGCQSEKYDFDCDRSVQWLFGTVCVGALKSGPLRYRL